MLKNFKKLIPSPFKNKNKKVDTNKKDDTNKIINYFDTTEIDYNRYVLYYFIDINNKYKIDYLDKIKIKKIEKDYYFQNENELTSKKKYFCSINGYNKINFNTYEKLDIYISNYNRKNSEQRNLGIISQDIIIQNAISEYYKNNVSFYELDYSELTNNENDKFIICILFSNHFEKMYKDIYNDNDKSYKPLINNELDGSEYEKFKQLLILFKIYIDINLKLINNEIIKFYSDKPLINFNYKLYYFIDINNNYKIDYLDKIKIKKIKKDYYFQNEDELISDTKYFFCINSRNGLIFNTYENLDKYISDYNKENTKKLKLNIPKNEILDNAIHVFYKESNNLSFYELDYSGLTNNENDKFIICILFSDFFRDSYIYNDDTYKPLINNELDGSKYEKFKQLLILFKIYIDNNIPMIKGGELSKKSYQLYMTDENKYYIIYDNKKIYLNYKNIYTKNKELYLKINKNINIKIKY